MHASGGIISTFIEITCTHFLIRHLINLNYIDDLAIFFSLTYGIYKHCGKINFFFENRYYSNSNYLLSTFSRQIEIFVQFLVNFLLALTRETVNRDLTIAHDVSSVFSARYVEEIAKQDTRQEEISPKAFLFTVSLYISRFLHSPYCWIW